MLCSVEDGALMGQPWLQVRKSSAARAEGFIEVIIDCFLSCNQENQISFSFNPLAPVLPVTGHDECWPLFHF